MSEKRSFKDIENKIHEDLFKNLYVLKYTYKTRPEFDRIFKKDMFVKNNKAAFYEVVYYLLNILNPELTKEKLTMWPLIEIKMESKFRTELLKYINELNHIYKHSMIPLIMPSHLISPGGFKFTKFMLTLSQLTVFEHLKKQNSGLLLHCPVPNKNSELTRGMLNNSKRITLEIEIRIKEKVQKFQEYQNAHEKSANLIVNSLTELDKSISAVKKVQTTAEEEFYKKYTLYPSISSLKEKLTALKQQWNSLSSIHDTFMEWKSILGYLSNNDLVIEHNSDVQKTSTNPSQEKLDLPEFFYKLGSSINNKSLELPNPSESYLQLSSEKLKLITEKYIHMQNEIDLNKQQIGVLIKEMFESLKFVDNLIMSQPKINSQLDFSGIKPFDDSIDC